MSTPGIQIQRARVAVVDFPGGPEQDALSQAQVEPAKPSADLSDGVLSTLTERAFVVLQGSRHSLLQVVNLAQGEIGQGYGGSHWPQAVAASAALLHNYSTWGKGT